MKREVWLYLSLQLMMGRIDPKCSRTRGTGTGDVHRRRVTFGGCQVTVPGGVGWGGGWRGLSGHKHVPIRIINFVHDPNDSALSSIKHTTYNNCGRGRVFLGTVTKSGNKSVKIWFY